MARTKQTARRSTGGKAPRQQLKELAARVSRSDRDAHKQMLRDLSKRDDVTKVMLSTNGYPKNFLIWVGAGNRRYAMTEADFRSLLGYHITVCLSRQPGVELTMDDLWRFGLTESVADSGKYLDYPDDAWDLDRIVLDQDGTYYGVDGATQQKHRILLYTLQILGPCEEGGHEVIDDSFRYDQADRILAYLEVDYFCSRNPGRELKMSYSRFRPADAEPSPYTDARLGPVSFQDGQSLCIPAAFCNAALLMGHSDIAQQHWRYFRDNATLFARTREPGRRIRDFYDLQKHFHQGLVILHKAVGLPSLAMVLRLPVGVYLVTVSGYPNFQHSICICTSRRIILDCAQASMMPLYKDSLRSCVGNPSHYLGVEEVRRVEFPSTSFSRTGASKRPRHRSNNSKKKRRKAAAARDAEKSGA